MKKRLIALSILSAVCFFPKHTQPLRLLFTVRKVHPQDLTRNFIPMARPLMQQVKRCITA